MCALGCQHLKRVVRCFPEATHTQGCVSVVLRRRGVQVCVVLLQLASWLELCHQTGFAHRNIKPSNVIQLSGSGNITVVDYGASARIGARRPQLTCHDLRRGGR